MQSAVGAGPQSGKLPGGDGVCVEVWKDVLRASRSKGGERWSWKSGQHVPRGEKGRGVLKEPRTPCLALLLLPRPPTPPTPRHRMGMGGAPGKPSFGSLAVRQLDLSLRKSLSGPQKANGIQWTELWGTCAMGGLLGFAIRRRTRLHFENTTSWSLGFLICEVE